LDTLFDRGVLKIDRLIDDNYSSPPATIRIPHGQAS
jgi:hypothetical protein